MPCGESLRMHAYFDGELDALASADFEQHAEHCGDCRRLLEDLQALRTSLRQNLKYERAPQALRERVLRALDEESRALDEESVAARGVDGYGATASRAAAADAQLRDAARHPMWRRRTFWWGGVSGWASAGLAAGAVFLLLAPLRPDPLLDELVNAHLRSLVPAHLIDVESTDRHTVKPWFAGRADVSPVVADFSKQGYPLVGGRADYFERQRAAVLIYKHGAHIINVFTWAASGGALPASASRNGYHIACWQVQNVNYCAVSDTGREELLGLVGLLRDLSRADSTG